MKYVDDYRDGAVARKLADAIATEAQEGRHYRLMEFCGGHTHTICRYGIEDLLPENVELIHGPGCPVCVLPMGRLDMAIEIARRPGLTLCTYGDMMRVPASERESLLKAKAEGADVRMIVSTLDALKLAEANPEREVVLFAIGFETTTPPTAHVLKEAKKRDLRNFSVFANHVLTPAAIGAILGAQEGGPKVDGFVGPGHVSTVIGTQPYEVFAAEHRRPVVVAGFEPLDLMESVLMLLRQLNTQRAEVENQYARAVSREGNARAQAAIADVFELRESFEWRGLGTIPASALKIRKDYAAWDAERKFDLGYRSVPDHKACACGEILQGLKKPVDCKIFGTACTPETPLGACMVSPEGSCAAYYAYGRYRDAPAAPERAPTEAAE